jgi:hypothetical protein
MASAFSAAVRNSITESFGGAAAAFTTAMSAALNHGACGGSELLGRPYTMTAAGIAVLELIMNTSSGIKRDAKGIPLLKAIDWVRGATKTKRQVNANCSIAAKDKLGRAPSSRRKGGRKIEGFGKGRAIERVNQSCNVTKSLNTVNVK